MILGIDPGKNGGLAFLDERGSLVQSLKMVPVCDFPDL